jgi:hypothetical protein
VSVLVARPREVVLPPWEMTTLAEQVYRRLGPWTFPDADNGFPLAGLVEALTTVAGWLDDAGRQGYEVFLDPDRCPWWALRWCGQAYGVRLLPAPLPFVRPAPAIEEAWRQEVRDRPRWRRGHPDTLIAAARRHMTGAKRVRIRERYDPAIGAGVDAPYDFQVRVRASDVLPGHNALIVRDLRAAKPLRLLMHVVISDALTYDDLPEQQPSYDALEAAYVDYNAMEAT